TFAVAAPIITRPVRRKMLSMFGRSGLHAAAASLALGATLPASAQTAAPTPAPSATPARLQIQPVALPLPTVTPDQADQLRRIIVQGRIGQGLRYSSAAAEILPADDADRDGHLLEILRATLGGDDDVAEILVVLRRDVGIRLRGRRRGGARRRLGQRRHCRRHGGTEQKRGPQADPRIVQHYPLPSH
ncbi:hypothetical protein ABS768_17685, partial [Flavobacterium sp. ST-75]